MDRSSKMANATFSSLLADAQQRYATRRPRGREAAERAARHLPGGNTRSVLYFPPFPLFVERSEGCRLWDIDGHGYVDFLCEYTAGLAGHDNPSIRAAVETAMRRGWVNGAQLEVEGEFARVLCERFPSLDRVRFCNSGTEANLLALTTARVVTGRPVIMAFRGGYHGGVLLFKDGPSPQNAPFMTVMAEYNDTEATRILLQKHASTLAAVILEPMMGSGGCIAARPEFLSMLREECTRHGILLIFDEVMTSRLAPGGLQEVFGVSADLTTLGKYIGGGFSFGTFGGRGDIMDRFDPSRPDALMHAGTFNNNPFTMNAGLAAMTEVYTPEHARALNTAGDRLRKRLQALTDEQGIALRFTGMGSMIGLHIANADVSRPDESAQHPEVDTVKSFLQLELLELGFYIARRGMIVLSLPMTEAEHNGLVDAVARVVDEHAVPLRRLGDEIAEQKAK